MPGVDLNEIAAVTEIAQGVVRSGIETLKAKGPNAIDEHQTMAYDLAHAASATETARGLLDYGSKGDDEAEIAAAFVADAVADLAMKIYGREASWGGEPRRARRNP